MKKLNKQELDDTIEYFNTMIETGEEAYTSLKGSIENLKMFKNLGFGLNEELKNIRKKMKDFIRPIIIKSIKNKDQFKLKEIETAIQNSKSGYEIIKEGVGGLGIFDDDDIQTEFMLIADCYYDSNMSKTRYGNAISLNKYEHPETYEYIKKNLPLHDFS